jgi:hypothetical protein
MNPAQQKKFVSVTPPAAIIDNAAVTTASIDTVGWDYLEVYVYLGAIDIAMTVCKLQTSDTDGSYADLTGAVYGTSTDIAGSTSALPIATDDNKCFKFEIDLRGKKRYFDLAATCGDGAAGTYITAFALLTRGDSPPTTASGRGLGNILRA